ncbi:G5 domain-containing protein [Patescibacteria group bacterium]|nr:G5 domain-containing protein [Patescibacteria group bacterium]
MKLARVLTIIFSLGIFLLLNNFDKRYYQPSLPVLDSNWTNLVFGVDSDKSIEELSTKYITVDNDGDIQHFLTTAPTPIDALIENGYSVSNMNRVITTSPLNVLTNNAYIILQTYRTIIEDITISVPFERITQGTTLCQNLSKKIVSQQGVLGVMTQTFKKTYEGGDLVASEIVEENLLKDPVKEIVILEGPDDNPNQVPQIGYNCTYWESYIDNNVSASAEEKQWLKFTMRWESGCNGESNKGYYKGLFQWDPCLWYEQFPNDNIFDGKKQIQRTLAKLRAGARPQYMWPAVYKKYVAKYGELSWLK